MSTGDPFYCHEHRCAVWLCERQKHAYETDESYKNRLEVKAHPECPSCRCAPPLPTWSWR